MATKEAWTFVRQLVKWRVVAKEGNRYPNHLSWCWDLKIDPSTWMVAWEVGSQALFVLQWISSVWGIKNPTPSREPLAFIRQKSLYRS